MQAVYDETKKAGDRAEQNQQTLVVHTGLLETISRVITGLVSGQQDTGLLSMTHKILQWNITIFSVITQMQQVLCSIPAQIQRDQPVSFEDAHGRVARFHVEFVNSYAAFQAILEARFVDMPGLRKVKRLEYVMRDTQSKRILDLSSPWETTMRPGRKFVMSMVFQLTKAGSSSCPGCSREASNYLKNEDSDIQWYEEATSHMSFPVKRMNNELKRQSMTVIILIAVFSFAASKIPITRKYENENDRIHTTIP